MKINLSDQAVKRIAKQLKVGQNPFGPNDSFVRGYLQAILFSETDESDENGGQPLDENYDVGSFSDEAIQKSIEDCESFLAEAGSLLELEGWDDSKNGVMFYFTRSGAGAGFWDGDYENGDELTKIAKKFGSVFVYVGDDGMIYIE